MYFAFLLLTIFITNARASVSGIIDVVDKDNQKLATALTYGFVNFNDDDLDTLYYALKGYNALGTGVATVFKLNGCQHIEDNYKKENSPESTFHAVTSFKMLDCKFALPPDGVVQAMKLKLENPSSTADIHYALKTLQHFGQSIPNPAKIAQSLQQKLKEDDSLQSLGHAMHACGLLGSHGKFITDRIEDVVVQADEVNGQMLQWEGGLTITSLLLTGLHQVHSKPLTQEQVDKFANYLWSRRSVQTPRGAWSLLEAADVLSKSPLPPVCITLASVKPVSISNPELKIRVSDLLGNPLKPTPSPVIAQSATRVTDDVVVLSKQTLTPGQKPTEFVLPLKLEPGKYKIALTVGAHSGSLVATVVGPNELKSIEIGIETVDGTQATKLNTVQYPNKLLTNLEGDANNNLVVKFNLPKVVHQAFLELTSENDQVIFIAERDASKMYKISVNLGTELARSGSYQMFLIIGDPIMSNPIYWNVGKIEVKLSANKPLVEDLRAPKPEIRHMFREAEKRPPQVVSMLFTGAAAAPLLLLLVLWLKTGVSFKYFNFYSIPFHAGFAGILLLYTYFWLWGNMFTTCAWLLYVGGFTFIAGNRMLRNIACKK